MKKKTNNIIQIEREGYKPKEKKQALEEMRLSLPQACCGVCGTILPVDYISMRKCKRCINLR